MSNKNMKEVSGKLRDHIIDVLNRSYGHVIDETIRKYYGISKNDVTTEISEVLNITEHRMIAHVKLTKRLCQEGSVSVDDFIYWLKELPRIGKIRATMIANLAPSLWWAHQSYKEVSTIEYIGKCAKEFRELLIRIHSEVYIDRSQTKGKKMSTKEEKIERAFDFMGADTDVIDDVNSELKSTAKEIHGIRLLRFLANDGRRYQIPIAKVYLSHKPGSKDWNGEHWVHVAGNEIAIEAHTAMYIKLWMGRYLKQQLGK